MSKCQAPCINACRGQHRHKGQCCTSYASVTALNNSAASWLSTFLPCRRTLTQAYPCTCKLAACCALALHSYSQHYLLVRMEFQSLLSVRPAIDDRYDQSMLIVACSSRCDACIPQCAIIAQSILMCLPLNFISCRTACHAQKLIVIHSRMHLKF